MRNADRTTKLLLGLLGAGVWALLAHNLMIDDGTSAIAAEEKTVTFDEITVKRVNVVDDEGRPRVIIANSDRSPPPVIQGKTYDRSTGPGGITFYDPRGNEAGGIALVGNKDGRGNLMIFDYLNSEAIGFSVTDGEGDYDAGFFILDRIPLDKDILEVGTTDTLRIELSNENGDSSLVLRDPAGKDRVVLSVDRDGEAGIEIRDASGKVVFSAP